MTMNKIIVLLLALIPLKAFPDARKISKQFDPAVIKLQTKVMGIPYSFGSGFFISSDGKILTNLHVVSNALFSTISTLHGTTLDGKDLGKIQLSHCSKELDLCLLKTKNNVPAWIPVTPTVLEKGKKVFVIGHPRGYDWTISEGIISGVRKNDIQITAPISPGNSGGPILDETGNLLGLSTWIHSEKNSGNLNFGTSVGSITEFLKRARNFMPIRDFGKQLSDERRTLEKSAAKKLEKFFEYPAKKLKYDSSVFSYVDFKVAGKNFQIPIFKEFPVEKCFQTKHGVSEILVCRNANGSANFSLSYTPGPIDFTKLDGKAFDQPTPIAYAKDQMAAGKWEEVSKNLTAGQKAQFFSSPRPLKCKAERNNPFSISGSDKRFCTGLITNDSDILATSYFEILPVGNGGMVTARVWVQSSEAVHFYYPLVSLALLGGIPGQSSVSDNGPQVCQKLLLDLYTAQKAHLSELGAHTTDLVALGVDTKMMAGTSGVILGFNRASNFMPEFYKSFPERFNASRMILTSDGSIVSRVAGPQGDRFSRLPMATAAPNSFLAYCSTPVGTWSIDHKKNILKK
jgi:hypothetical protein